MPIKISGESLNACSGCEISILDMGETFLDLLEFATIVHLPLLMDSKQSASTDDLKTIKLPEADVGLISGGIKNRDHIETACAMREACDLIIAFGTCATHGGIPSLANAYWNDDLLNCCFNTEGTDKAENAPDDTVPDLMEACSAVDEHIHVDIWLPGCPPHPDHIFRALESIEKETPFCLPERSVCESCPASRQGKGNVKVLKRPLELPGWRELDDAEKNVACYIEQGFLCMGPVTRDGCGGVKGPARCIMAQVPCRGCHGPVKKNGNQRLDMLNALVSNDIDVTALLETVSLHRFSGAHGHLCPSPGTKEPE